MRQKFWPRKQPAEEAIKDIRRVTRRHFSAEEKIRVVLEGLRGEESIAELCRREGIASSMYYGWSKEFLEAGKKRLAGDTARRDLRRGEGSPPRSASVEGGRSRPQAQGLGLRESRWHSAPQSLWRARWSGRRLPPREQLVDPSPVHIDDLEPPPLVSEMLANFGKMSELGQGKAGDRMKVALRRS